MSALACVVAVGALSLAQETKTFRDEALGLAFQHPTAWTIKKEKYSTDFRFTLGDGSEATVQVFRTAFRQEAETWQQLQREVTAQLNRQMVRQWEETILGVPLLLSKIEYNDGSKGMSILVGLLYTRTVDKLNFRVNSTAGGAQGAEEAWRGALMTLRTISGELPLPEDPTLASTTGSQGSSGQKFTTLKPDGGNSEPTRTKNSVRIAKLGNQLDVFLPDGWTLEEREDKTWLKSEKLRGTVEISFTSGSRANVPIVLKAANNSTFDRFKVVSLRDETGPGVAKSGSLVASTLRVGSDADNKEVIVWHAVGTLGTIVWRLDYTCSTSADLKSDQKAIERLRELLAVEIAR
jgi:hypothetical protein